MSLIPRTEQVATINSGGLTSITGLELDIPIEITSPAPGKQILRGRHHHGRHWRGLPQLPRLSSARLASGARALCRERPDSRAGALRRAARRSSLVRIARSLWRDRDRQTALEDITATQTVNTVILRGMVEDRAELDGCWRRRARGWQAGTPKRRS